MPLTDKEAQVLERLEEEKERRIAQKIEAGEAIRGPVIVVGASESVDAAHGRAVAELRKAGEKREIVFPKYETDERGELREAISVVITGVPRAGRESDDIPRHYYVEPPSPAIFPRASRPAEGRPHVDVANKAPTAAQQPDKQIEHVERIYTKTQTEGPSQANPGGRIAEGWYMVRDGTLHVEDMQGRLLGRRSVKAGDNIEALAREILREKTVNDFWAPIRYH
jgi:hypothetical protein